MSKESSFVVKNLERNHGARGWAWPSVVFGLIVGFAALTSTFNGIPFAFVSFIGGYIEYIAISTVIYAPEYTFFRRFLYGIPIWLLGALLIRLGGMDTVIIGDLRLNLYLWNTLIGMTYYAPNFGNKTIEEQENNALSAGKAIAKDRMKGFPLRANYENAKPFAESVVFINFVTSLLQDSPEIKVQANTRPEEIRVTGNFEALDQISLMALRENPILISLSDEASATAYFVAWHYIQESLKKKGIDFNRNSTNDSIISQIIR